MTTTGSLAWSRRTGGTLSPIDRLRLTAQALLTRLARWPAFARQRSGLDDRTLGRFDTDALPLPDSADARRALAHAALLTPGWLYQHSLRTYLWAALLARGRGIAFDAELLLVASALHDLGLAEEPRGCDFDDACFAVHGARAAGRFADQLGWPTERRDRLAEAISLHLNVRVGLAAGAEAHLLHAGAALDCIGARLKEIPSPLVTAVLARHPRQGFKQRMAAALDDQATVRYASRAAFLARLGFNRLIQAAPFAE